MTKVYAPMMDAVSAYRNAAVLKKNGFDGEFCRDYAAAYIRFARTDVIAPKWNDIYSAAAMAAEDAAADYA